MRVCDRHADRRATESIHIANDDAHFDLCAECKTELLAFLCTLKELDASPVTPPPGDVEPKARKGLFFRPNK